MDYIKDNYSSGNREISEMEGLCMKRIGLLLKEMKIKRLEKELVGLEDGFEKANIEFELRLLKNSLKENKSYEK